MSDFVANNRHLREVLIFSFHSKKTAAKAHRELQKVYGDIALSETTYRDWFRRFKDSDFDVDDHPREGRPKIFKDTDVIYYELLKPNETITGERHRTQLMRLSQALCEKRPQYEQRHEKVAARHDNAPSHSSLIVTGFLAKHETKVIAQPLYSPDLAPWDFLPFPELKYPLRGTHYEFIEAIKRNSLKKLKAIPAEVYKKCMEIFLK